MEKYRCYLVPSTAHYEILFPLINGNNLQYHLHLLAVYVLCITDMKSSLIEIVFQTNLCFNM